MNQKNEMHKYLDSINKLKIKAKKSKSFNERREINLKVKELIEKALEIEPDSIRLKIDLMYVNINLREYGEAGKIGNSLIGETEIPAYLTACAMLSERIGDYKKAIYYIEKCIEQDPNRRRVVCKNRRT